MFAFSSRAVRKYLFRFFILSLAAAGFYFFARTQNRKMTGNSAVIMPKNVKNASFNSEDKIAMLELAAKFGAAKTKIEKKLEALSSGPGYGVSDAAEISSLCLEAENLLSSMRRDEDYKTRLGELDCAETVRKQLFYESVKLKVLLSGPARRDGGFQQELRAVETLLYKIRLYLEGLGKS